jgi:hypothetical protein
MIIQDFVSISILNNSVNPVYLSKRRQALRNSKLIS